MYIWAIVFITFLPTTGKLPPSSASALTEVVEGFKSLRMEPDILLVLIFNLFAVVLAMPYQQLLPVFVEDILKVGAGNMGILVSFSGIGAIAGSLVSASLPNRKRGLMLLVSSMFLGLVLVSFSFFKVWGLSLGVMVLIGMGQTGRITLNNIPAQYYSSDQFRGRIMGIFDMQMSFPGFTVLGAALLTGIIGMEWAVSSFTLLLVAVSLSLIIFVSRLRRLD